jgi:hypothetical protein
VWLTVTVPPFPFARVDSALSPLLEPETFFAQDSVFVRPEKPADAPQPAISTTMLPVVVPVTPTVAGPGSLLFGPAAVKVVERTGFAASLPVKLIAPLMESIAPVVADQVIETVLLPVAGFSR